MSASGVPDLFTKLFLKAGFEWVTTPRGKDKLGWKGQQFPWVEVQYIPDPWGRRGMDTWMNVRVELENRRGLKHVDREKMLFEERMTDMGEIPDIVERAVEAAEESDALRKAAVVGNVVLDNTGARRKVSQVLSQKGGYDQPAPIMLEGRSRRFAYAELDIPEDEGGRIPFMASNGIEVVFLIDFDNGDAFAQNFVRDEAETSVEAPSGVMVVALAEGEAWVKATYPQLKLTSIAELKAEYEKKRAAKA